MRQQHTSRNGEFGVSLMAAGFNFKLLIRRTFTGTVILLISGMIIIDLRYSFCASSRIRRLLIISLRHEPHAA